MGRLVAMALATVLFMGFGAGLRAEPAATSELSIVPAGTMSSDALVGPAETGAEAKPATAAVAPEQPTESAEAAPKEREEEPAARAEETAARETTSRQETAAIPAEAPPADQGERDAPSSAGLDPSDDPANDEDAGESTASAADDEDGAAEKAPKAEVVIRDPETPAGEAVRAALAALPDEGEDDERAELEALAGFYGARAYEPLWLDQTGYNDDARAVMEVFDTANEWGLDPKDFPKPERADAERALSAEDQAALEIAFMQRVLLYARHARGGRIMKPSEQLNSNLDRKAQLIAPDELLETLAAAPDKGKALIETHPQQPQFHLLREKYVEALGKDRSAPPNAAAKRLRANMEMWRWKWPDIGDFHLIANVPAYVIRAVENGETVHKERIVVGELGKQTSIFSRRLRDLTFRPMWRVPESIKVRELWPSLLRGGGMMRQYGLEVETKSGRRLDWRTMDWPNIDIRKYEVVQPPGPNSAMGYVKFSFPSQHTIFMHDTPDKWMFNRSQRTLSAGCLRLRNPLRMAEIVLAHDKGWDAEKVDHLAKRGAFNNEILIEGRIPMHIVYQTAWVNEDGKLELYRDIYGHEKRVTLALDGKWDQINKGRNHLAPHVPDRREVARARNVPAERAKTSSRGGSANTTFMSQFGSGF